MKPEQQALIVQFIKRLFSANPDFFKKLQGWVVGIAFALIIIVFLINFFDASILGAWSDKIYTVLWYVVTFLGGLSIGAQAATTKPELQDDKTKTGILKNASITDLSDAKQAK